MLRTKEGFRMSVRVLSDTPGSTVTLNESQNIVRVVRKSTQMSVDEIVQWVDVMQSIIPKSKRSKLAILQDMRAAPMLSDPEKEKVILGVIQPFFSEFCFRAIVIQTAVGRLQ